VRLSTYRTALVYAKTTGDAYAIVSKSPLTNDGFKSAWGNLMTRFENRRLLVNSQLKILFNLSVIGLESGVALKELQSTIQGCLVALRHSSISTENWDCVFLKLPKLTLSLWKQSLSDKSEIPKWKEMNKFLKSTSFKSTPTAKNLHAFETKVNAKPQNCNCCFKENHPIRLCSRFLQLKTE